MDQLNMNEHNTDQPGSAAPSTDQRDIVEMSVAEMLRALAAFEITSVDLVCAYLNRIAYYDRTGLCLHAIAVLDPRCLENAAASDARRRRGQAGPLEGIPFTVKDSYKVAGLTVASGSPALAGLIASEDAATVTQLRAAGAVLLGKTNMPPMAAGGIQPGAYDYTRSPYHPEYLTAAYGSGSSSGSGTAVAANLCAFGMGEETVSSGRSPASNNSLVAYTPSRGVLSIRGNWPLRPTCDVVVPHTRSVADLLLLLDTLAVEDTETRGDFWRQQSAVTLPAPSAVLPQPVSRPRPDRLDGVRIGVPRLYIGEDRIPLDPPVIRPSVRLLWDRAAEDLRALGAEVVEVDFPVVSNYEEDRPGAQGLPARGLVPPNWRALEGGTVTAMALDGFLRDNADPALNSWADVDGDTVFPLADAPVPVWITRARGGFDWQRLAELVKEGLPAHYDEVPGLAELLRGLERARELDFEQWLTQQGLDLVAFPAAGDVGRDDLFRRPESLEAASRNGVVYSNGNRVIRHLGIPTVTVPMGFMADIQMPVGLTFAGPAYSDDALLNQAGAFERATSRREPAFLTPTLPSNRVRADDVGADGAGADGADAAGAGCAGAGAGAPRFAVSIDRDERSWLVEVRLEEGEAAQAGDPPVEALPFGAVQVWADGHILRAVPDNPGRFTGRISLARRRLEPEILVVVKSRGGEAAMRAVALPLATTPGPPEEPFSSIGQPLRRKMSPNRPLNAMKRYGGRSATSRGLTRSVGPRAQPTPAPSGWPSARLRSIPSATTSAGGLSAPPRTSEIEELPGLSLRQATENSTRVSTPRPAPWYVDYRSRLLITDVIAVAVAVYGTQLFRFGKDLNFGVTFNDVEWFSLSYTVVSTVLVIAWLVTLKLFDTRDRRIVGVGLAEYRRVINSSIGLFGIVAIIAFLLQILLARGYIITALPVGLFLLLVGRLSWRVWLGRRRRAGLSRTQVVLLGSEPSVLRTVHELSRSREAGFTIVAVVLTSEGESEPVPIAGVDPVRFHSIAQLRAVMDASGAGTVVVTSSEDLPPGRIRELSWSLEPGREHLVLASALTDIGGPRIHTRPVAGLPLIYVETPAFGGRQRFAKRLFDIVASTLLILISSPILLVIAVLVKTTSPGPVLFRQERIGLNGRPFRMLKFRSMVVDAEARLAELRARPTTAGNDILFKMTDDPRVTRVGAVLRRYSLDEIPQFLNVFRGEMSLIGPRPPLAREVEQYEDHVHRRFMMKPGITGLWQVSGRSNLSWEDTVRHDLYYVENWSMTEDIVILLKTVRAVFGSDGAY